MSRAGPGDDDPGTQPRPTGARLSGPSGSADRTNTVPSAPPAGPGDDDPGIDRMNTVPSASRADPGDDDPGSQPRPTGALLSGPSGSADRMNNDRNTTYLSSGARGSSSERPVAGTDSRGPATVVKEPPTATGMSTAPKIAATIEVRTLPELPHAPTEQPPTNEPTVLVTVLGATHLALVDTGAARTCIHPRVVPASMELAPWDHSRGALVGVDRRPLPVLGTATIPLTVGKTCQPWPALVIPDLAYGVIIGIDLLVQLDALVDMQEQRIFIGGDVLPLGDAPARQTAGQRPAADTLASLALETDDLPPESEPIERPPTDEQLEAAIAPGLDAATHTALLGILKEFRDVFASNPKRPGTTSAITHSIDTGDHPPVYKRAHRLAPDMAALLRAEIDQLLANGLIRPSTSPWAAPTVFARKKDGTWRLCVDYRGLNAATRKDAFPLPRIDDILARLGGAKIFSTLDLASGYWQVLVDPAHRHKTAFITPFGLFEWNVMPFGLCNAPLTFQRLMHEQLRTAYTFAEDYIDDVLVHSAGVTEHLEHLRAVLTLMREANLHLKLAKCTFGTPEVAFLGHVVSAEGVSTDPAKITAIQTMPAPANLKELRAFLGLTGYYRRFVPGYATVATPLHDLVNQAPSWRWTAECQAAFERLKVSLATPPVLAYPRMDVPFEIHTDASNVAIGVVLAQVVDGVEHPVAYWSRRLSATEKNWSATDRECLAVVEAVRTYKHLLGMRRFKVITDHSALHWLMDLRDATGRLARWQLELQHLHFDVSHRPGRRHANADALSRLVAAPTEPHQVVLLAPVREEMATTNDRIGDMSRFGDIGRLQRQDPTLAAMFSYLEAGTAPTDLSGQDLRRFLVEAELFTVQDGKLWYTASLTERNHPRLVIPTVLRATVLRDFHDDRMAGHLGLSKTYARLRQRCYWRGMFADVAAWIATCSPCNSRKTPRRTPPGELQPITVPGPWHTVAVDVLGPLPESNDGNKYVLVFGDLFTKWAEAFAMARQDAQTVAHHLVTNILCRFGAPIRLLSDRGQVFLSEVLKGATDALAVKRVHTSAYHPQTDGQVERFNKTLADMLACYTATDQKDWDEHLPFVVFAYNCAVHPTTSFSPYHLLFGREPNTPADVAMGTVSAEALDADTLRDRMARAHAAARDASSKAKDRQRAEYNNRGDRSQPAYTSGDLVWLYTPHVAKGRSKKLAHLWQGPYAITERTGPVTVRLRTPTGRRFSQVVHVSRLKPATDPNDRPVTAVELDVEDLFDAEQEPQLLDEEPAPTPIDADPEFPVNRILASRRKGRGRQFLLEWANGDDPTWEPSRNVSDDLIEEFDRAYVATAPSVHTPQQPEGIPSDKPQDSDLATTICVLCSGLTFRDRDGRDAPTAAPLNDVAAGTRLLDERGQCEGATS